MPMLREIQEEFSRAILSGDLGRLAPWIDGNPGAAQDRFAVYRGNCDGALVNALKLTYPAVLALVGDAFFEQAAHAFSRAAPPHSAFLTAYGADFGDFLAAHPQTVALPYLGEVARLEWAVAQVAQQPRGFSERRVTLGAVALAPSSSLTLLTVRHRACAIWRAALAADETELARIALDPAPGVVAIWRAGAGADVAELSPAAAAFVQALLTDADVDSALARLAELTADPIATITAEVLRADFVELEPLARISGGEIR